MTPEAEIVNVRFHKSVIASKAAFTYADAQKRVDDKCVPAPQISPSRHLSLTALCPPGPSTTPSPSASGSSTSSPRSSVRRG